MTGQGWLACEDSAAVLGWLQKLYPGTEMPEEQPAWTSRPFIANTGREQWTCATDGHLLVALAGQLEGAARVPADGVGSYPRSLAEQLARNADWQESYPSSLLRRWCGPAEYRRRCDCTNALTCPRRCSEDGGWLTPAARPMKFAGQLVDATLLACAVEHVTGPALFRWGYSPNAGGPAVFDGPALPSGQPGWRILLVPMIPEPGRIYADLIGPLDVTAGPVSRPLALAARDDLGLLPILADALEEEGCGEQDLLGHLRGPGPHAHGCWAVDLLLGKE